MKRRPIPHLLQEKQENPTTKGGEVVAPLVPAARRLPLCITTQPKNRVKTSNTIYPPSRNKKTATEAASEINKTVGEGLLNEGLAHRWFQKFSSDDTSFERKKGSGQL
ncbi:unnamed protein product [Nezara viridula]|uniref:Mos1 transposase HTH domain-containing protein n=1 Tax=Nezara viridula TaxID=85310 RepID=A0A9P0MV22_NEZVI|nr:unnamed protein product [Nezara viridula]